MKSVFISWRTQFFVSIFALLVAPLCLARTSSDFDEEKLENLRIAAEAAGSHAVVIVQNHEVIAEWYFGHEKQPIETMSVLKSLVSLGIGNLLLNGDIDSLDQPVHEFYPEWKQGRKQDITILHLLNHTSGLQNVRNAGEEIYPSPNAIQLALAAELVSDPGSEFSYNNKAVNLLAGIIHVASGQRMDNFFVDQFFGPMAIDEYQWDFDASGNPRAMAGLALHAHDLAKFGRLVLNQGAWNKQQLVSSTYIEAMLSESQPHMPGVGLLWWIFKDRGEPIAYFGQGCLGQFLLIVPEHNLVAVRQVAQNDHYDPETDGFGALISLVLKLVD